MQTHPSNNSIWLVIVVAVVIVSVVGSFGMPAQAATETVLHAFQNSSSDGAIPVAGMVDGNGTYYGTTEEGGASGNGAIVSYTPKTGTEKLLYSFCSQARCADGATPMGGLVYTPGVLYGTTELGGKNTVCRQGCGTIFSYNIRTGAETVLYAFQGANVADGANPMGSLVNFRGTLYGTTYDGGDPTACNSGCGTVFSFVPKTATEAVVYTFEGANNGDGQNPTAGLIYVNSIQNGLLLYGTTEYGGASNFGMVFSTDTSGDETDLYDFQNSGDGAYPTGPVLDYFGTLYGTTNSGGTGDAGAGDTGTVFSLNIASDTETVLYSFCSLSSCSDGANPVAGLTDVGGTLYGTTEFGGPNSGDGTVFSINRKTGAETVVYTFCQTDCSDGDEPTSGLIDVGGNLIGTTQFGGTPGKGVIFEITKPLAPR